MKTAARRLVDRYISDWHTDLDCIWEVERPFELHLSSVIVVGRADVILNAKDQAIPKLTIVDYKTYDSNGPDHSARDQLRTYTAAARAEGYQVGSAILHNLKKSDREEVSVNPADVNKTVVQAEVWAKDISQGKFVAKPLKEKCKGCDYKRICQYQM